MKKELLEKRISRHVDDLLSRYEKLEACRDSIIYAYQIMEESFASGGKLLAAGNGGSAADAGHIAGELMKRFQIPRPVGQEYAQRLRSVNPQIGAELAEKLERGLMTIPLTSQDALATAYMNDVDAACVFAQQLFGLGRTGDVFLGISTSGSSRNILYAAVAARAGGIRVVGLTGRDGGELAKMADAAVKVPETETYKIQELHLPVYHCWCRMLEEHFFGRQERMQ